MRDEENELRALFVSARDDSRISHPHTHLIDVFSSLTTFVGGGAELDELRDVPTLARFHTHRPPAAGAPSVVPSVDVFRRQFSSFAGGLLEGFDWTNLVAAGSSALIPALPLPRRPETWRTAALTDADYERLWYLHLAPCGLDDRADLDFVTDDPRFFEALQTQWDSDETVPEDEQAAARPPRTSSMSSGICLCRLLTLVCSSTAWKTSRRRSRSSAASTSTWCVSVGRRLRHVARPPRRYIHVGSMKVSRTARPSVEVRRETEGLREPLVPAADTGGVSPLQEHRGGIDGL